MSVTPVYLKTPIKNEDVALSPEALMVRNALIESRIETPMIETSLSREEKYEKIL